MNIDAPCGSAEDVTYYAPWRFPGTAPVIDACGVAGGVYQWQGPAAAGGDYSPTVNARRGDRGSELPRLPSVPAPSWAAGSTVEVAWSHKAWHGGGYQYRLCPVGQTLSEACFQALPLPFADNTSMLRWGGAGNPSPNPSPNTRLTLTLGASRTLTLTLRCDGSLQARWTVQGLRALVCCGRCERGRHRA